MSGTPGGDDNGAVVLNIASTGVVDLSANEVNAEPGFAVAETADTVPPEFLSGAVDYQIGVLVVQARRPALILPHRSPTALLNAGHSPDIRWTALPLPS